MKVMRRLALATSTALFVLTPASATNSWNGYHWAGNGQNLTVVVNTAMVMVHSAGEERDYSIPLSGVDAGTYTVDWRATSRERAYRGSFSFTVRS